MLVGQFRYLGFTQVLRHLPESSFQYLQNSMRYHAEFFIARIFSEEQASTIQYKYN